MKKILAMSTLLLGTVMLVPKVQAQNDEKHVSACIHDGFGYVWSFPTLKVKGNKYSGSGTVDLGGGVIWNASISGNSTNQKVNFAAINPSPDGCTSYTDSFFYKGTATAGIAMHQFTFTGSGSWKNYCNGTLGTGTWAGTDCAHKGVASDENLEPGRTDKKTPVCITDGFGFVYSIKLKQSGAKYSGKGTVDIGGGLLWNVVLKGGGHGGAVTFTVTNPAADGCASGHTDGFTFTGTATESLSGTVFSFNGSGTWNSYCSGSVAGSGTWTAANCAAKGSIIMNHGQDPTRHQVSALKVSPNPVTNSANIAYTLSSTAKVNITVYNSMQQPVKVLVNEAKTAGNYSVIWDTRSAQINAGLYRVVATVDGKVYSTTVMVVR